MSINKLQTSVKIGKAYLPSQLFEITDTDDKGKAETLSGKTLDRFFSAGIIKVTDCHNCKWVNGMLAVFASGSSVSLSVPQWDTSAVAEVLTGVTLSKR